jgi:hypothetical protein
MESAIPKLPDVDAAISSSLPGSPISIFTPGIACSLVSSSGSAFRPGASSGLSKATDLFAFSSEIASIAASRDVEPCSLYIHPNQSENTLYYAGCNVDHLNPVSGQVEVFTHKDATLDMQLSLFNLKQKPPPICHTQNQQKIRIPRQSTIKRESFHFVHLQPERL